MSNFFTILELFYFFHVVDLKNNLLIFFLFFFSKLEAEEEREGRKKLAGIRQIWQNLVAGQKQDDDCLELGKSSLQFKVHFFCI